MFFAPQHRIQDFSFHIVTMKYNYNNKTQCLLFVYHLLATDNGVNFVVLLLLSTVAYNRPKVEVG